MVSFNLNELVLVEATAEQAIKTNRNTYEQWGSPQFTIDQYLQREKLLKDLDYTRENFQVWVLVPANDTKTLEVISSCETFKEKALYQSKKQIDHYDIKEVIFYGIASVFTPKKYRKNGYASKIEVGSEFYSKLGWKLFPHSDLHSNLKLRDQLPSKISSRVKLLDYVDALKSVIKYDCDLALKEFEQLKSNSVLILPSYPCYEWLLKRNEYHAKKLGRQQVNIRGAVVLKNNNEGTDDDILGFIIWCHNFGDNELLALRFRSDGPVTTRTLMNQARLEAEKFDLNSVVVWNLDPKLFKRGEGEIVERKSSLPQLAWHNTDNKNNKNLIWFLNEKYSWC